MKFKTIFYSLAILTLTSCTSKAQQATNEVKIVGEMKNVMWNGQLYGSINLDTIANKTNLYGLGPVEYLTGEILIIDGKSYKSTVISDSTMKVEETYEIKAPFFGYANIDKWTEQTLPDNIQTIHQLEQYLDKETKYLPRPFMFKISGIVEEAAIHIVNLPKGSKVSSPDEAHKGQINYKIINEQSEIVGFFSTKHKAIFTHHDTFLHMHLITFDKQKMGHLDKVLFKKGTMKLYLPKE
ncbi:MAG: acetolactate decarboxylase [Brumimicrobium sp.]